MVDLEADDAPGVVASDPVPDDDAPETPASDPTPAPADKPQSLEDLYDFDGPPVTTTPTPSAPADATPPVAPVAAPEVPVISAALQQRAEQMGFTPEVTATFKDPMQLEAVVRTAENAAMQAMQFTRQQMQPPPVQAPVQQQQTLQIPAAPAAPVFDPNAMRNDLASKNFDPSLVEAMVGLASQNHAVALQNHQAAVQQRDILVQRLTDQDRYNQQSQQFMQGYQQQLQQINAQHQKELLDRDYDTFSAGLADPVKKLVTDPATREQIWNTAMVLANGMASTGKQLPTNPEIFKTAMYAALGDKIHQAATETVRQEVRTHQNRATSRPSSGVAATAKKNGDGYEAAGTFADNFWRQNGWPSDDAGSLEV